MHAARFTDSTSPCLLEHPPVDERAAGKAWDGFDCWMTESLTALVDRWSAWAAPNACRIARQKNQK